MATEGELRARLDKLEAEHDRALSAVKDNARIYVHEKLSVAIPPPALPSYCPLLAVAPSVGLEAWRAPKRPTATPGLSRGGAGGAGRLAGAGGAAAPLCHAVDRVAGARIAFPPTVFAGAPRVSMEVLAGTRL